MNEPLAPPKPDVASPRVIGSFHLLERLEVREVGTLSIGRREGAGAELVWVVDTAAWPEIAATWTDVVRALSGLRHPNVLTPRASTEQGTLRALAFPQLVGETATNVLRRLHGERSSLPWPVACRIVSQAALGLHALHTCRDGARRPWPLHGSVSGSTIMIGFDGATMIFDPGRLFPLQAPSNEALAYAAPERVWSEPSDARADVFALGVLLWELCSGRRLFRGRDDDETRALLEAHVVPELASRIKGLPPSVDALLRRALARNPEDRFDDAGELAMETEALADTEGGSTAEVAAALRTHFAERERELRAHWSVAAEATEIRSSDLVLAESSNAGVVLEEQTLKHAAPRIQSSPTFTREEATLPRMGKLSQTALTKIAPGTGSVTVARPRFESQTETLALDVADSVTRRHEPSASPAPAIAREDDDPPEQKTLPRISSSHMPSAKVVPSSEIGSDQVVLLPDSNKEPTTRRVRPEERITHEDSTAETPLQATRARIPTKALDLRSEDMTPTNVRPDPETVARPHRPQTGAPRAITPLEAPPKPRRPSTAGIRVARGMPAEPVAVAKPGPVPAPPRPPARTVPPAVAPHASPSPLPSPLPPPPSQVPTQGPAFVAPPPPPPVIAGPGVPSARPPMPSAPTLGGPPTLNAPPPQPTAMQTAMPTAMPTAMIGAPSGAVGLPPMGPQPMLSPVQQLQLQQLALQQQLQQQQMQQQLLAPQVMSPHMPVAMPMQAQSMSVPSPMQMQGAPPGFGVSTTTSESVAYGPLPPATTTVIDEPAEKVIVDSPNGFQVPAPPPPEPAPPPPAPARAAETSEPPREPLLIPRDPQMSAMQRAMVARESVREPDRKIAVPVVVVALILAVGVAIGIPLLSRKPTRVVTTDGGAPRASAEVAQAPVSATAPALQQNTGVSPTGPVLQTPSTLGPAASVPPPLPGASTGAINPFALPDARGVQPGPQTQTQTPTQRPPAAPQATRPPRTRQPSTTATPPRTRDRSTSNNDDDDDAPLPKEFEKSASRDRDRETKETEKPAGKGLLTVVCSPPCDEVLDGSRSLGPSPVVKASVSAGTHRLTLRVSDPPLEKVVTVTVSPDETTFLTQPMTK